MILHLSTTLVEEVKRQSSIGIPQRKIAKSIGVSRGTVENIIHKKGRYTPGGTYDRRDEPKEPMNNRGVRIDLSKVERCPGCGAMVEMPCRACVLRKGVI